MHVAALIAGTACALQAGASDTVVYWNDFNGPPGTRYPEWAAAHYSWTANAARTIAAGAGSETIVNLDSPNGAQRFLGELGGPVIVKAPPYDRAHFVRVDESIDLSLDKLPAHRSMTLTFDLYVLKSWDGDSPIYGPDRWKVAVAGSQTLLETTFSNNRKTSTEGSFQSYPAAAASAPQTGAGAVNTLGYGYWFGDATYHFAFTFPHSAPSATLTFSSSLFEGKAEQARATRDESWGLDNVRVTVR